MRARLAAAARHVAAHGATPHRHRAALGGGGAPRAAGHKRGGRGTQRDSRSRRHLGVIRRTITILLLHYYLSIYNTAPVTRCLRQISLFNPPPLPASTARWGRGTGRRGTARWQARVTSCPWHRAGISDSKSGSWMLRMSQPSDRSASATPRPRRSRPKEWANVGKSKEWSNRRCLQAKV